MTKSNLTTAVAGALLALFCAALLPTSGAADWIKRPTAIRNLQTTTMDPGEDEHVFPIDPDGQFDNLVPYLVPSNDVLVVTTLPLNANLAPHTSQAFPTTDFSDSSANQPWTLFTVPFGAPIVLYSITYPPNGDVVIVPVTSTGARTSYYPVPPPDLTDYFLRIYALGRAGQTVTAELSHLGYPLAGDFTDDIRPGQIATFNGLNDGNQFWGISDTPIVGDVDLDGIDDIGVWTPDGAGATPGRNDEWYFLVSGPPPAHTD